MATTKATQSNQKPRKTSSYACHICDLNGHKMTNFLKFIEKKMFHGKFMIIAKVQPIAKTQIITIDVNVNIATKSKVTKRTNVQG